MSVNISIEHINILEKEIAFMKEQKDVMDKRLTDMKEKNVSLAKRLSSNIIRLECDNKRVANSLALQESAIKKATAIQSRYDALDDEMTLIKAEKDTMVDAWNVAVKKGQGFETALREERVKYNSLMAELELSKVQCLSLAEKECEPVITNVIEEFVKPAREEFVKAVRVGRLTWKNQSFVVDDDGNIYKVSTYSDVSPPIGKWNPETKTCSWYIRMVFIDKSLDVIALD